MPRIDFYILQTSGMQGRLEFACKLIEKAYKSRHRIFIYVDDTTLGHDLDELLWTYRDDSFLPHHLYGDGPEPAPPIQIGIQTHATNERDILINLGQTVPAYYAQFSRIIELVSNDTDIETLSREHYRHYRAQGHNITTHKLQLSVDV